MDPDVHEGMNAICSDVNKLGEVVGIHQDHIVVERGLFFPTYYYVPWGVVSGVEGGEVYLGVTVQDVLNSNWNLLPEKRS